MYKIYNIVRHPNGGWVITLSRDGGDILDMYCETYNDVIYIIQNSTHKKQMYEGVDYEYNSDPCSSQNLKKQYINES